MLTSYGALWPALVATNLLLFAEDLFHAVSFRAPDYADLRHQLVGHQFLPPLVRVVLVPRLVVATRGAGARRVGVQPPRRCAAAGRRRHRAAPVRRRQPPAAGFMNAYEFEIIFEKKIIFAYTGVKCVGSIKFCRSM